MMPDSGTRNILVREEMLERNTLCVASANPGFTLHRGDEGFLESLKRHYTPHENNAAEKLVLLKSRLASLSTDKFWTELMEGITDILGSQYVFVVKRILTEEQQGSVVEMPAIGEPGSCLMAIAFYYDDGHSLQEHVRDYKYLALGDPCAQMKHDKVFLVPSYLSDYIKERANEFQIDVQSYIGIPLSSKGKCFAHFGALWSLPGLEKRNLSWGFVEMTLHALEDLIIERLLEGKRFSNAKSDRRVMPVPKAAVTAVQSLRPYARSLSHELRTPMQGVVGMLDLMYALVQEALESPPNEDVASVFRTLRENIEVVQDSSRRAVEAADNVVQAYDLDMQIPGTPEAPIDDEHAPSVVGEVSSRTSPRILHSDLIVPMPGVRASSGSKRRRSQSTSSDDAERSPKHRAIGGLLTSPRDITPRTAALRSVVQESSQITGVSHSLTGFAHQPDQESLQASPLLQGAKVTKIRELMRIIVNEALSFGGRPDSAIATETELGERIDVRTRSSKGDAYSKIVEWSVAPTVPEDLLVDERDFTKLVSVLFLNALKFTTKGQIKLQTSLSPKSRYVVITVIDTGTGIPAVFRPNLFKPFSREDDSLTRQSEGLGLGLMVAKGLARKVGGDLICVRSDTEGPQRGSEFELRVPLSPSDGISRHSTPSRTPTPFRSDRSLTPTFMETSSSVPNPPKSPVRSIVEPTQLVLPTIRALDSLTTNLLNGGRRESEVQAARATRSRRSVKNTIMFDRKLAQKCPLNFLIAEDNRINRKLLVNMLSKLGYTGVHEAYDGTEAVRLMELDHGRGNGKHIDVILMDLWMPDMDGYEAAERILAMEKGREDGSKVKILAVTADITDVALDRAREVGMVGYMTKPYKLLDLERLIIEHYSPGPGR